MLFEAEQTPPCESSAAPMRHWWTYDGVYSDRRDRAAYAGVETKISDEKTRRKRNLWNLRAAHEQQPKRTKSSGRMNPRVWRGRRGRDEGGAGSGPWTVGGEELSGAAEG